MAALFVSQFVIVMEASQVVEVISGNCTSRMAAAAHHVMILMNFWAAFFQTLTMATRSALERYFQRLPVGDGGESLTSTSAGSSIASSANDGHARMRLLHSVCPPAKRRKFQPQGVPPRSNPAVKLLTAALHVEDEGGTRNDNGGEAPIGLASKKLADLATDQDTVVLENLEWKRSTRLADAI